MKWRIAVFAGLVTVGVIFLLGWLRMQHGFSARDQPSSMEAAMARMARQMSIPSKVSTMRNPEPATPENVRAGMDHFADHCALCHGNDGSGDTVIGKNLYPKVPDMRLAATQNRSDGELYSIIHNGVRLSGMPAWGESSLGMSDMETWQLVHFIRHLPHLTPAEQVEMEALNPTTPEQRQQDREEYEFLHPGAPPPPETAPPAHVMN